MVDFQNHTFRKEEVMKSMKLGTARSEIGVDKGIEG